jgi:hypothetical protein
MDVTRSSPARYAVVVSPTSDICPAQLTALDFILIHVRFQVLTAASMKIRAFWDIAQCNLVRVDRRFTGAYCLHHQVNCETSVYSNENTLSYIPEGSHLHHNTFWWRVNTIKVLTVLAPSLLTCPVLKFKISFQLSGVKTSEICVQFSCL